MTLTDKLVTSLYSSTTAEIQIALPDGMVISDPKVEKLTWAIRENLLDFPLPDLPGNDLGEEVRALRYEQRLRHEGVRGELHRCLAAMTEGKRRRVVRTEKEPAPRIVVGLPRLPTDAYHQVALAAIQPWVTDMVEQAFEDCL